MRFVSGGAGAGAAAVALALLLAGCVGDPAPIVTRTPSEVPTAVHTPEPTPSPTPTALTDDELFAMMPDGADREDLFGAMVTAQFFLEQYSVMFQTGDTRVWEALSGPECGYCADALENAERVRDEGWVAEGGDIVVDETKTQATLRDDFTATVLLVADVDEAFLTAEDGERTTSGEAREVTYAFELAVLNGQWHVARGASES